VIGDVIMPACPYPGILRYMGKTFEVVVLRQVPEAGPGFVEMQIVDRVTPLGKLVSVLVLEERFVTPTPIGLGSLEGKMNGSSYSCGDVKIDVHPHGGRFSAFISWPRGAFTAARITAPGSEEAAIIGLDQTIAANPLVREYAMFEDNQPILEEAVHLDVGSDRITHMITGLHGDIVRLQKWTCLSCKHEFTSKRGENFLPQAPTCPKCGSKGVWGSIQIGGTPAKAGGTYETCPECEANFRVPPGGVFPPHKFRGQPCPGSGTTPSLDGFGAVPEPGPRTRYFRTASMPGWDTPVVEGIITIDETEVKNLDKDEQLRFAKSPTSPKYRHTFNVWVAKKLMWMPSGPAISPNDPLVQFDEEGLGHVLGSHVVQAWLPVPRNIVEQHRATLLHRRVREEVIEDPPMPLPSEVDWHDAVADAIGQIAGPIAAALGNQSIVVPPRSTQDGVKPSELRMNRVTWLNPKRAHEFDGADDAWAVVWDSSALRFYAKKMDLLDDIERDYVETIGTQEEAEAYVLASNKGPARLSGMDVNEVRWFQSHKAYVKVTYLGKGNARPSILKAGQYPDYEFNVVVYDANPASEPWELGDLQIDGKKYPNIDDAAKRAAVDALKMAAQGQQVQIADTAALTVRLISQPPPGYADLGMSDESSHYRSGKVIAYVITTGEIKSVTRATFGWGNKVEYVEYHDVPEGTPVLQILQHAGRELLNAGLIPAHVFDWTGGLPTFTPTEE
jgi:predicted RNA-binding Zn-ribbon protein involved in translation (DUF1610 family)